jgi:hypothetical protein
MQAAYADVCRQRMLTYAETAEMLETIAAALSKALTYAGSVC